MPDLYGFRKIKNSSYFVVASGMFSVTGTKDAGVSKESRNRLQTLLECGGSSDSSIETMIAEP
jgi:ABC-type molybdenum transport system ATPase subunit/photorepair protein PhrA